MEIPSDIDNKHLIFGVIFMLSTRLQTIGDSFFEEVTAKQWFVLLMLSTMKGHEPTLNELSNIVGSSHQNVKQLVLKLEQKGYVVLKKDEDDARRLRIQLTSKAEEFSQSYSEKSDVFLEKMYKELSMNNLTATLQTLITIQDNLSEIEKEYVK